MEELKWVVFVGVRVSMRDACGCVSDPLAAVKWTLTINKLGHHCVAVLFSSLVLFLGRKKSVLI